MANSYTTRIKKRLPAVGDENWDDEWHDNEKIDEVVMGALLSANRLISGGGVTGSTGLNVDYAALVALLAGVAYTIGGSTVALTAAASGAEQANWIYVAASGVVTVSTSPPSGNYVPLYRIDASDTAVIRIADLRPLAADLAGMAHAATAKTTLADADEIPLADSADLFGLKRITRSNLKKDITIGLSGARMTYGGTANAITLTTISTTPVTALVDGAQYRFKATAANTAAATLSIDGLTAYPVLTITGVSLPAGYIRTTAETVVRWDSLLVSFVADRVEEYGVNANGDYWRYANGLMLCTGITPSAYTTTISYGGLFIKNSIPITFPATFAEAPRCSAASVENSVSNGFASLYVVTATTATGIILALSSSSTAKLQYSATGKWY